MTLVHLGALSLFLTKSEQNLILPGVCVNHRVIGQKCEVGAVNEGMYYLHQLLRNQCKP